MAAPIVMSNIMNQNNNILDVLVVDDMEFNVEIVSSILKQQHIPHTWALNGKIAVEKVKEFDEKDQPFKVIIMDCDMPEMNGWQASKLIDQMFREGKIRYLPRIVGYSAYTSDEDIKLCYESGMVHFLAKPCPSEKIISTVRKYLF